MAASSGLPYRKAALFKAARRSELELFSRRVPELLRWRREDGAMIAVSDLDIRASGCVRVGECKS